MLVFTYNVDPLYSVLENENLNLRPDKITQGNCQAEILKNALRTEDDYFVAPPELCLTIVVPMQDVMPYFVQWQRYRKYWWSSITTTPSLFTISDIKDIGMTANVNIIANFNWGQKTVETLTIDVKSDTKMSNLKCKMTTDDALITLLLDGLSNRTKEEYLHLHNKIAPYKIALALDYQDSKYYNSLMELAKLIMHKLEAKNISTRCPNMLMPLSLQLKENFQMGVTYTAIIAECTLTDGIFQLLNSSTMLKEHLHLADFESYAALLGGKGT
ncbi:unnamed protein product, partial [Iphiclides podalirius]